MKNNGRKIKLSTEHILILIFTAVIGAVLYYALLWQSLGGWMFEHIGMPIMELIFPDSPNILEGIVFVIFGMSFLYIAFFIPYIAFWLVVTCFILIKILKQN